MRMASLVGTVNAPVTPIGVDNMEPSHESHLATRWWNVNMPAGQWTVECPQFLQGEAEKNVYIMSIRDEDHPRISWDEVKLLIETNRIDQFHRMPSDLRRYIKYCYDLRKYHGSVLHFIQQQRLEWPAIQASGDAPFTNDTDYKILYNDWPYSIDRDITHLVVWTKFVLEDDPQTGHLQQASKVLVEDFVFRTFCDGTSRHVIKRNDIRWFKNWTSLRSVHALEHFHIMLYKAPAELIDEVTGGDRPMLTALYAGLDLRKA